MKITSDLVEKAKSGNSIAWNELYSATFPVAYGVAMQLVKNKDVADDIVQDSYITAFTKLDTLEDNEKFQHWFNRIVANNCKNYLVKKKPDLFSQHSTFTEDGEEMEFDVVDDRTEYQPDNAVISNEIKQLFYDMVAKLPEEQRTCALMFWVQELTIPEIAEILGVSQNTVKSRIHYAKKKLTAEADDMKKKGISVFSITGFALIPFLRWLFKNGSGITASPEKAEGVLQIAKSAGSVAKSANTVTNTVKTVTDTTKAVNNVGKAAKTATTVATKTATKSIATKIIAGVLAASVGVGGITFAVKNKIDDVINDNQTTLTDDLTTDKTIKSGEDLAFFDGIENFIRYVGTIDGHGYSHSLKILNTEAYPVNGYAEADVFFDENFSCKVGEYELIAIKDVPRFMYTLAIYHNDIQIGEISYYTHFPNGATKILDHHNGHIDYLVAQGDVFEVEARICINNDLENDDDYDYLEGEFTRTVVVPELGEFLKDGSYLTSENVNQLIKQVDKWATDPEGNKKFNFVGINYYGSIDDRVEILAIHKDESGSSVVVITPALKPDGTLGIFDVDYEFSYYRNMEYMIEKMERDAQTHLYPI